MVVVRVKGAIKVIDLRGATLYILTGPVAQLTFPEMGVSRVDNASGRD